jgi:aspartate racemase
MRHTKKISIRQSDARNVFDVRAILFDMNYSQSIGLIGGLGVGAAVHYYEKLAEAHARQGIGLDLAMGHAETSRVFHFVSSGDRAGLAGYLAEFLQRLAAAGAELGVIPAVTPHFCIHELQSVSPLPVISIFDPLIECVPSRSVRRVATFGTRFVMESDLFGMLPGVEFVHARPDELDLIHRTYLALAESRQGTLEAHHSLTELAQTLCSRDGVDSILLAGTDLALLFNETNTQFPAIDCAALHLDAIVKAAIGGARLQEN